jgi:hypothetical protein
MNICICGAGEVVVHDMLNIGDIETTGGDVGCYQDRLR